MEMTDAMDITLTPGSLHAFYSSRFSYYTTLSTHYQGMFTQRCLQFLSEKEILAGGGFVLTPQVKALVAASAVQLTLGLDTWNINYFETIVIYPAEFENTASGLLFKGETNVAGFIKLSWKSFMQGYNKSNDNINLGLHEFSHALRFNNIKGAGQDYFFEHYFNAWLVTAYEAYVDIKSGRDTIFRKYGGANINEFISVCIEHYFESPAQIRERYPQLYYATGILLNQQTDGRQTNIGLRHAWLELKNDLLPGFEKQEYKFALTNTFSFFMTVIIGIYWLATVFAMGIFEGPGLFLTALLIGGLLLLNRKAVRITLDGKRMLVKRGLFWLRQTELPVSCLVSFRQNNKNNKITEWQIIFYNKDNDSFYEEKVYAPTARTSKLFAELELNEVARPK